MNDCRATHYLDDRRGGGLLVCALVDDLPHAARLVVGDVERAVLPLGQTDGAMRCCVGLLVGARESVGKDLVLRRVLRLAAGEGNERDVVTLLRSGCAIPRSVESDERTSLVVIGKGGAAVEHQSVRCPVGGEKRGRGTLRSAVSYGLPPITGVL